MVNKQKKRRDDNLIYSSNPGGHQYRDRKYPGNTKEEKRDAMLIGQVIDPHKNPFSESVNYREIAKEKKIKKITNKDKEWILIDGAETYSPRDNKKEIVYKPNDRRGNSHEKDYERTEAIGTYDSNNGVVTFVDENGDRYIAAQTDERMRVLQKAGYKHKGQYVPCSNGELPTDPELKKKFIKGLYRERQIAERDQNKYLETAHKKNTLEHHVTAAFLAGIFLLIASFFFFSRKITAYAISDSLSLKSTNIGAILFIIGAFLIGLFLFKKMRK